MTRDLLHAIATDMRGALTWGLRKVAARWDAADTKLANEGADMAAKEWRP